MKNAVALLITLLLSGCASHLVVSRGKDAPAPGVPFRSPVLVSVETTTNYQPIPTAGENKSYCTPDVEVGIEAWPLGESYYANIQPSPLADGEFSIEFNEKGGLSKISMNSKASSGVDKTGSFLSTVLPFIRAPKAAPETASSASVDAKVAAAVTPKASLPAGPAEDMKALYCLKKSVTKKIVGEVELPRKSQN